MPCYHSSVSWSTRFRNRRMQRFARELHITAETRVLDVGGTPDTWDMLAVRPRVTLLNTPRTKTELAAASWWAAGDGRALPFRWFPVEQHLLTPLVHWLPKRWQRWIVPRFTFWSALVRPTPDRHEFYVAHYLEDVRLLGVSEFAALFPGARLIRERVCGWTKSLVAMRPQSKRNVT